MHASSLRLTIRQLMIIVVIAAGSFALLRLLVAGHGPIVVLLVVVLISVTTLYPVRFARPSRGLLVATWIASLWPLSIILSLHTAWVIAYGYLGHKPGPADNGQLIELSTLVVFLFMVSSLFSTLLSFCLPLGARSGSNDGERRWNPQIIPLLLMPLAWLMVWAISRWDPVDALDWWID